MILLLPGKILIRLCTTQIGGDGIYRKFPNGSERLFKFNEFVKNTATVQFWVLWGKDIRRITIPKECLGDMTDFFRIEATVRRYLQECRGDTLYISQICAVYYRINTSNVSLVQSRLINESALSTGKVVAHLTLNKSHSNFLAF